MLITTSCREKTENTQQVEGKIIKIELINKNKFSNTSNERLLSTNLVKPGVLAIVSLS